MNDRTPWTRLVAPIRTVTIGGRGLAVFAAEHHSRGLCIESDGLFEAVGLTEVEAEAFRQTHGMTRPSGGLEIVWTDRPVAVLHRNAALTVVNGLVDDATMAAVEAALSPATIVP